MTCSKLRRVGIPIIIAINTFIIHTHHTIVNARRLGSSQNHGNDVPSFTIPRHLDGYNPNRLIVRGDDNSQQESGVYDVESFVHDMGANVTEMSPEANCAVVEFENHDDEEKFRFQVSSSSERRRFHVEQDTPIYLFDAVEETETETNDDADERKRNERQRRNLSQDIPWGISRVFEDSNGTPNIPPSSYLPSSITHPICIIDSGYQLSHPDLSSPNSPTTHTKNADPLQGSPSDPTQYYGTDSCHHGSHVAGTILASDNSQGVVGVFPGAPSLVVKIFNGNNCAWIYRSRLTGAIAQCVAAGAKIISMSIGGSFASMAENDYLQKLYDDEGVLFVAAAGNSGDGSFSYPASYNAVISVGATKENGNIASFSQYNSQVDLSAPGSKVESTIGNNGYDKKSGTSMATPHVSGLALLLWNKFPTCTNKDIRDALEGGVVDLGTPGRDDYYGKGEVNYWKAVSYLMSHPCEGMTVVPTMAPVALPPVAPPVGLPPDAPTAPCSPFVLELRTDKYGQETTWVLKNKEGRSIVSGGSYEKNSDYTISECLPEGLYEFEIFDSYGDGICCNNGDGKYELRLDGSVFHEGGDFEASEKVPFEVSLAYDEGDGGDSGNDDGNCSDFEIELTTDNYGREVSWELDDIIHNHVILKGDSYASNDLYIIKKCISSNTYKFKIFDTHGDGICCDNGRGSYRLKLDGLSFATGGEFEREDEVEFVVRGRGDGDDRPTASPTTSSSCHDFQLDIDTDKYGIDTTWSLTFKDERIIVTSGGPYEKNSHYTVTKCLSEGSYEFVINDEHGDGLCCRHGRGSYKLSVDDKVLHTGGEFTSKDQYEFTIDGSGSSPSATPIPTSSCDTFEIELHTDNYGRETTWSLIDKSSSNTTPVMSGGPYDNDTKYVVAECLTEGSYEFVITDANNDGMCCGYGRGSFTLKVNGEVFHTGGNFFGNEKRPFDIPLNVQDDDRCSNWEMELKTDNYSTETSWELEDSDSRVVIMKGDSYAPNKVYFMSECIVPGSYTFKIFDSHGDGLCCRNGNGYYKLRLNGEEIYNGGEFSFEDEMTFRSM